MSRQKKTQQWFAQHINDPFVKQAVKAGYRSRASIKLLQLQEKDKLFRPGMCVVDLGAAPGGWSQVAQHHIGKSGQVVALDRLPMDPIAGVEILQGDFEEDSVEAALRKHLPEAGCHWVLSDMSPNLSGHRAVDQPRAIGLCEYVFAFAQEVLREDGGLLMKVFHGEGFDTLIKSVREHFSSVVIRKPLASRSGSREVYLLAKNRKLV